MTQRVDPVDILILSDDIGTHSGFAVNARLVTHALDHDYAVANASLQATQARTERVHDRDLRVYPARNDPYRDGDAKGKTLFSKLVRWTEPDLVISVIDPQMCMYLGSLKQQNTLRVNLREPGQPVRPEQTLALIKEQLRRADFTPTFEWLAQVPLDGAPTPRDWSSFFAEVDHPVAMSRFGQRRFREDLGVDATLIPHAVDHRDVADPEDSDAFLVGTVNRNQPRKQYPRLIEAWGEFYDRAGRPNDIEFYLHCDYNDASGWDIQSYLERYGIAHATRPYEGTVTRERLMELYASMDVFCSATAGEGFGLTTVEAMSQGTPVVITDYTTSGELVSDGQHGPRGSLIPVSEYAWSHPEVGEVRRALVDTDAFADTLVEYYGDGERCVREGEAARVFARERYGWERIAGLWRDAVAAVMD